MLLHAGFPGSNAWALDGKATRLNNISEKLAAFQAELPEDRVYLMFDKPFYFPGETIWFQAYVRNGADMAPSVKSEIVHVEWIGPAGNILKELSLIARKGTASGDISLDGDAPGGLYTVKAYTRWQKNSPEPAFFEKEISVQHLVLPRVKMKLDFLRKSYGKGDEVMADFEARGQDDKPLAMLDFTYTLRLKGQGLLPVKGKTDEKGKSLIRFKLPDDLAHTDALLNVTIPYQGMTESISRSVPILNTRLQLGFFPEGGDLVVGLSSRAALRALDPWGKPADMTARIETDKGTVIEEFSTLHDGMGSFRLTPAKGERYLLRVIQPKGIEDLYPLPEALERGYVLEVLPAKDKTLDVLVRSTENETLTLAIRSRGTQAQFLSLGAKKGENRMTLDTGDFPMGVCQITLFDQRGIERAERLVFVNADRTLNVKIVTDKEAYLPREKVTMLIGVADDRGMPVPSQLSLSVADDGLLTFADDKSGRIFSKLLLEPDLKGTIYEPSYYFDQRKKDRDKALDLLMMTQGWRRFTWERILSQDKPSLAFAGEKAEIRGFVYSDPRKNDPIPNAEVKIESSGKTVITDEKGAFVISDLDLYEIQTLTATDGKKQSDPVQVSDYNQTVNLYLAPGFLFKKGFNFFKGREEEALPGMAVEGRVQEAEAPPEWNMAMARKPMAPMPKAAPQEKQRVMNEEKIDFRINRQLMDDQDRDQPPAPCPYIRARVFPAPVYTSTDTPERTDFRSTVYFKGQIETDRRGIARIEFYNSDAIASFRAIVEGIGAGGLVGRGENVHHTQLPFSLDLKSPVSVAMGDKLNVPLIVTNNTEKPLRGLMRITPPSSLRALEPLGREVILDKTSSKTLFIPFEVMDIPGMGTLTVEFGSGKDKDAFRRDIRVVPRGFPVRLALSDQVMDRTFNMTIQKPVTGSIQARFTVYPTVLSDMLAGIEAILQEPYGCFEQASSSTYPNIMVMNYVKNQERPDAALVKKATDLIDKGYKRLTSYETKEKGYEWFGETPGHEALTAYGLMEFKDMEKVYAGVDAGMVQRTAQWLLEKRDGQGGFIRNEKALDSFGRADADITNAYIVYALSEAGFVFEIQKELDKACETALTSDDPYQLALVANALFNVKDKRKDEVLGRLIPQQAENGSWTGKKHSVTCSTGTALSVETTALTLIALLKSETPEIPVLDKGVRFILASRSSYGGFGNTQSTVLALKALTAFAQFSRRTAEAGVAEIQVNGKTVAEKAYGKGEQGDIVIPEDVLTPYFKEGDYSVRVLFKDVKNPLPYTFALSYNTFVPISSKSCDLGLETKLDKDTVTMGDTLRMSVTLSNKKEDKGLPMSIAIIGIPGGLSVQPWQLKELSEKKKVDYYEVLGNDLVIYYRQMAPGQTRSLNLDLKAETPGNYEAAASSAYLYYTSEHKTWVKGETVTIKQ